MTSTFITTLTFALLTPLIYLLLSTLHIYCPNPTTSATTDAPPTHDPDRAANVNATSNSEFLFRVGTLHIYGIRTLFIVVVVGGSLLSVAAVAYTALTHRKTVERDISEKWRNGAMRALRARDRVPEGWWGRRFPQHSGSSSSTLVVDRKRKRGSRAKKRSVQPLLYLSYTGGPASSSSSPPRTRRLGSRMSVSRSTCREAGLGPQGCGVQRARRALSFLRGRTRERDVRMRRLGRAEEIARREGEFGGMAIDRLSRGRMSGCEIPSYYLDGSRRLSALSFETDSGDWRSSGGIPSYYLKEHDAEGRSINEPEKRPSFEIWERSIGKDDCDEVQYTGDVMSRIWTGSTAVSEDDGGKRRVLSSDAAGTAGGGDVRANRDGDEGWDTVYCSGWRGTEG